jgi:hypothetical protein
VPQVIKTSFTDRDHHQDILKRILRSVDDEGFLQTLWAVNALQSDCQAPIQKYLRNVQAQAATSDLTSELAVYKWEIEDLANELFSTPKRPLPKGKVIADHSDFRFFLKIIGTLRALQNAEDGIDLIAHPLLKDLRRLISRQFDWQRGYFNQAQFYRSTYVYGQGACADFFFSRYGITINELSFIGFGTYCFLDSNSFIHYESDWSQVNVSAANVKSAFDIFCTSAAAARKVATELRSPAGHSGYKPSFLRRFPCVLFPSGRIRSPLPQLLLERVTSGLYFDVVDGGGDIRRDYGRRFEDYCHKFLVSMLPGLQFDREWSYGSRSSRYDSPDIICKETETLLVAFECKATRMSFSAKISRDPLSERGFVDLTKAIFQLWRFFAHCRLGKTGVQIDSTTTGVVLTLENWLTMAPHLYKELMAEATVMADDAGYIVDEDRRPIAFCAIADVEGALQYATEATFLGAIREAAQEENFGWMFSSIHQRFEGDDKQEGRPYPFSEELGVLLPWWRETGEHSDA